MSLRDLESAKDTHPARHPRAFIDAHDAFIAHDRPRHSFCHRFVRFLACFLLFQLSVYLVLSSQPFYVLTVSRSGFV